MGTPPRALLGIVFLIAAALLAAAAQAQPVSGREYQELNPHRPVSTGERVEVIEFFYYGCPVCYEAQPHIARWLTRAGPGVALLRVPAVFTESSESFARSFYALGAMNEIARLHWPLYDNHHFDGKQLNEEKNITAWVAANGVDRARFTELWKSDQVTAQVESAKKALESYGIKGVPSFVVDGKYVTSAKMAGSVREMVRVVEYLVERAATERKK
jgi:protein dithiol oxidoreductase (disulfide-forming)